MSEERSYIAFISYRHLPLDKQAATLVQKKIENYTIPKEFREQFGGSKFGHVFRDEDELPTTASLTDSIYYALDHARFLIVICTPGLPKSQWCEAEIKYFLKTHDRDHVLVVLADGDPEESFSPYLLHDFDEEGNIICDYEPLAANISSPDHKINKKALNKEMMRIFASFLGCPFDSLWQRERRARANRLLGFAAVAISILCVFLGVVLNRNARIQEQNEQISAQNVKIEEQNTELQSRLSSVLVDAGRSDLEGRNITGALENALASMESGDPDVYDHRVGSLLADALGAYYDEELRSSIVYSQSTDIKMIRLTDDKNRLILVDEVGVIRCLDLSAYDVLWEVPTENSDITIYTDHLADRVIYKSAEGVFCLSLTDGAALWSLPRKDMFGNAFQAISQDGSIFAVIEDDDSRNTLDLVFLSTKDGSELGRVDLADDEAFTPYFVFTDASYAYPAAFSSDNSRFVFGIPGKMNDEEESEGNRFFFVDMGTFEKTRIGTTGAKYRMFYGIDIDPSDDSVFIAAYTLSSVYTIFCSRGEEGEYQFTEKRVLHSFSQPGGIISVADYFDRNECRFLSKDGRIYIFSDNQMFVYDRTKNEIANNYVMTGAIINAFWTDPENYVMEIVSDDAYIIDYYMDYSEGNVMSSVLGQRADQVTVSRICPTGSGSLDGSGSYYTISSDSPGRIYLIEFMSDPNGHRTKPQPDDLNPDDVAQFVIEDYSDTGLMFYNSKKAAWFDKNSGAVSGKTEFEDYLMTDGTIILDDSHFLYSGKKYGMDGSVQDYATAVPIDNISTQPYESVRLSGGQILSWKETTLLGYKRVAGSESAGGSGSNGDLGGDAFNSLATPQICAVWLDGKPVESLCDTGSAVLIYNDFSGNGTLTYGGENGLILRVGTVLDITDAEEKNYAVREEKELCFIDALAGKAVIMKESCPSSGDFKPALSHIKHLCAAAYEDGNVCVYDTDRESAEILKRKYDAGEVVNLCFSDNDDYLLILTSSGILDIYETGSLDSVFSEQIEGFNKKALSLSLRKIRAQISDDGGIMFVSLDKNGLIIETGSWMVITELEGNSIACDMDADRVYIDINSYMDNKFDGKEIVSYPLYDIPKLKEWAKKELGR